MLLRECALDADADVGAAPARLMERAADEIERLLRVIDDYARISAASRREIDYLRSRLVSDRIVVVRGSASED